METKNLLKQSEIYENACNIIFDRVKDINFENQDLTKEQILQSYKALVYEITHVVFTAKQTYDFMNEFIKFNTEHEND